MEASVRNIEAASRGVEAVMLDLEAVAIGIANTEMRMHQFGLSDKRASRSDLS
jgi:hypothetical protein